MSISSLLKNIPIEQLSRGQYQPRRVFEESALVELAESIKGQGVIEPIIVRAIAEHRYEIIAGERRWRASQLAGLTAVPCIIRDYTDAQAAEVTLIENIQREALNPIEEAQALLRLIDDFSYTHEAVAKAVGQSRGKISNTLRLLQLDNRVQAYLISGELSGGHGKMLAGLNAQEQMTFAKKVIDEAWSVRQLEQKIQSQKGGIKQEVNKDANLRRLERLTAECLGTDVQFQPSSDQRSGYLSIKYEDHEVLAGILEKMGIQDV